MKTRASHFLKVAFMALLVSTLFVSCGKKNSSGGSSSDSPPVVTPNPYGGYTAFPGDWLAIVSQENPCRTTNNNQQRIRVEMPVTNINVNAGAFHVGVTPEGDIAVVSQQAHGQSMELYLCPRPDLTGQGQLITNPVLNTSPLCEVGEITAADVVLTSNSGYGNYILKFAPIDIIGTDRYSSLCR